jgi:hypothetical protein
MFILMFYRMANIGQAPSQNAAYQSNTYNTGYEGNTQYQGQASQYQEQVPQYQGQAPQYPGQAPQYPYFMSPPNSGSVLPSLIYPTNMPPPYPPH